LTWAPGGGGGEVRYTRETLDCRALQLDHAVCHAYVDRHLATGVLSDAARWTTTHAAN